jgi:hypothetical protein
LDAHEVSEQIFCGKRSPRWVRENLQAGRVKLGHNVFWEETTVKAWLMNKVQVA